MALPVFLLMALLGGFIGIQIFPRNRNKLLISLCLLLPFVSALIENQLNLSGSIFTEKTSITISASDKKIWENITRVRQITEDENNITLFQLMGFPRPIQANLDTIAVGGVRKAIFAKGLFFTETITQLSTDSLLAFKIEADPKSIPPIALDEHILVCGKYFDVLEGKYTIEKIDKNIAILHLQSSFRLSTRFNFYSGLLSKLIMRDIQKNILQIIKARSEEKNIGVINEKKLKSAGNLNQLKPEILLSAK